MCMCVYEREWEVSKKKRLYFGCRGEKLDFYYKDELKSSDSKIDGESAENESSLKSHQINRENVANNSGF